MESTRITLTVWDDELDCYCDLGVFVSQIVFTKEIPVKYRSQNNGAASIVGVQIGNSVQVFPINIDQSSFEELLRIKLAKEKP